MDSSVEGDEALAHHGNKQKVFKVDLGGICDEDEVEIGGRSCYEEKHSSPVFETSAAKEVKECWRGFWQSLRGDGH